MPRSKSSTGTFILGSMNMREPGIFHARALTGKVCSRLIFLLLRASNTRYALISLVSDAGSSG